MILIKINEELNMDHSIEDGRKIMRKGLLSLVKKIIIDKPHSLPVFHSI
jgi:hypothetical protein